MPAQQSLLNSASAVLKLAPERNQRVRLDKLNSSPLKGDGTEYTQLVVTYLDASTATFKFAACEICHLALPQGASVEISVVGTGSAYIEHSYE